MNLQSQLEVLKQQATQSMIATDTPSIENPSYYRDTKLHQQSLDLHRHHNNHHQDMMTSYYELDQDLNTFNQYHNGNNDTLSASVGYISYS